MYTFGVLVFRAARPMGAVRVVPDEGTSVTVLALQSLGFEAESQRTQQDAFA